MSARERTPEKALMRDYIDSRRNLGEYLLPSVVVILAITVLGTYLPNVTLFSTLAMYVFILAVFIDGYLMWRGFKRVLAKRLPGTSPKGLLMYGMTRSTQIRRFRMPPPGSSAAKRTESCGQRPLEAAPSAAQVGMVHGISLSGPKRPQGLRPSATATG
jgi:hypothetical protein